MEEEVSNPRRFRFIFNDEKSLSIWYNIWGSRVELIEINKDNNEYVFYSEYTRLYDGEDINVRLEFSDDYKSLTGVILIENPNSNTPDTFPISGTLFDQDSNP